VLETPEEVVESTRLWRRSLLAGNILVNDDLEYPESRRRAAVSRG
jgi:hypothetical protein